MDKRLLLLGILLFIAGFVIAGLSYNPSTLLSVSTQNIAIAPGKAIYSEIDLNTTSFLIVRYDSIPTPINFYVVNQSVFSSIAPYLYSGNLSQGFLRTFEGKGFLFGVENSTGSIFPYNASINSTGAKAPFYISGNLTNLPSGRYYLIYQNPSLSYVNATYRTALPNSGILSGNQKASPGLGFAGIISALFVLVGIVLVVLSFIRFGKAGAEAKEQEKEITAMYKKIEAKEKRSKAMAKGRKAGRRRKRKLVK